MLLFAPACTFLLQLDGGWVTQLLGPVVAVASVVALREVLLKAGQPGWAALVPLYDVIVLLRVVGRPWWWLLLMLVPLANVVVFLFICLDLARAFGRSAVFGVGLLALAPIYQLILAFGGAEYVPAQAPRLPRQRNHGRPRSAPSSRALDQLTQGRAIDLTVPDQETVHRFNLRGSRGSRQAPPG